MSLQGNFKVGDIIRIKGWWADHRAIIRAFTAPNKLAVTVYFKMDSVLTMTVSCDSIEHHKEHYLNEFEKMVK